MNRFGDFTLLESLGQSTVADRYRAIHDAQGGPFFLKCYRRLRPEQTRDLVGRADRLVGLVHPNLCKHTGHSEHDGVHFTVAPLIKGMTLEELVERCRARSIILSPQVALYVAREIAAGVAALHRIPGTTVYTHGELSAAHVRITPEGQVLVTGLATPRNMQAGQPLSTAWDAMGIAALSYDLFAATRPSATATKIPGSLGEVATRALTPQAAQVQMSAVLAAVEETARLLKIVNLDRTGLLMVLRDATAETPTGPVHELPTLEPLDPRPQDNGVLRRGRAVAPAPRPVSAPNTPAPKPTPKPVSKPEPKPAPKPPILITQPVERPVEPIRARPPLPSPDARAPVDITDDQAARTLSAEPPSTPHATATSPAPFAATAPQPVVAENTKLDDFGFDGKTEPGLPPDEVDVLDTSNELGGLSAVPVDGPPELHKHPPLGRDTPREVSGFTERGAVRNSGGFLTDPLSAPHIASPGLPTNEAVEVLMSRALIDRSVVDAATARQRQKGGRLLELVMKAGDLDDAKVADVLAAASVSARLSNRQLDERAPAPNLIRRLPQTYVLSRRVLPLKLDGNVLELAMLDPFDDDVAGDLRSRLGATDVKRFVVARRALGLATRAAYTRIGVSADPLDAQDGPLVLLCMADDDAMALAPRFADHGMSIEHASTPDLARKIIIDGHLPDAIVCAADRLPRDGDSLLGSVRARTELEDEPFFVIGPADDLAEAAYVELGADDYFARPLNYDVVVAKLRRAVQKHKRKPRRTVATEPPPPVVSKPIDVAAADIQGLADLPDLAPPPPSDPGFSAEFSTVPQDTAVAIQPTGVMGTLKQMAVSDIVQSLELGRKTARVELHPMGATEEIDGKGTLGFTDGTCTYADMGELRGDKAFYKLASYTEGFFRIRYGEPPPERNIHKQTQFLLLEAMRMLDEEGA